MDIASLRWLLGENEVVTVLTTQNTGTQLAPYKCLIETVTVLLNLTSRLSGNSKKQIQSLAALSFSTSEVHESRQPLGSGLLSPTLQAAPPPLHTPVSELKKIFSEAFLTVPLSHFYCALSRHLSSYQNHRLEEHALSEQAQGREACLLT